MKKLGNGFLGGWLVLTGLIGLTDFNFRGSAQILAIIAVAAGIILILADRNEKLSSRAPDLVLGAWLVLVGLMPLLNLRFRGSHAVLEVLAVVAGILVLIRR
jgi:hypothetical protein